MRFNSGWVETTPVRARLEDVEVEVDGSLVVFFRLRGVTAVISTSCETSSRVAS